MKNRFCILLGIALLSIALIGCYRAEPEPTPTPIPTPIIPKKPTYVVQRGTVVKQLEFLARVAPVEEYRLFFRMGGYVKAVHVERGDAVTAGQILAELDVEDLHKQLAQAQVSLETAQLQLEEAQRANAEQVAEARIALEKAELRLAKARAQDPSPSVAIAKVRLEQAANNVRLAQAAYDRRASRPGAEASPEALQLQRATQEYQIAQAEYDLALQSQKTHEYDVRMLEKDVELARMALERLEAGVDPLLVKAVETNRLTVDRLKSQVEAAQIISPIDGEIMSLSVYEGRSVDAFKPVIIVADTSNLELSAELTGSQMRDLAEGMECIIRLSTVPGQEWTGQIRRLPYPYGGGGATTALDQEDTSTRVNFDARGLDLEPGDLAKVIVVLERKDNVLYLPPQAIRTFEGRKFVVVKEGDGQRRVDVKVGIKSEDRVEILEGLEEGQVVIGL